MSVTAARAANQQTIDTSGGTCYIPSATLGPATGIVIACQSTSSYSLLVNVAPLHSASEFFEIEPGQAQAFRAPPAGLGTVTIKGLSGSALAGWAIFR